MVLRQLLHGAHRGQPKTSRRPGVETLHGPVFATPALRATVDEPVEEIPGETPSSRIAFGDPDNTTFREIERTKKYVVLELVTGGFYAEPQGDRHRRPLSTVVLSANRAGRATKCRSSYRVEKKAVIHVQLADEDAEIQPFPTNGGGHRPDPELDRLSNILKTFNDQFGNIPSCAKTQPF